MSEEKKEQSMNDSVLERLEKQAIEIAQLKFNLQKIDSIAQELVKDAKQETLDKLGIKLPEEVEKE